MRIACQLVLLYLLTGCDPALHLISSAPADGGDGGAASTLVHHWSKRLGGTLTDFGRGVALHGDGNVALAGSFMGDVDFGGGPLTGLDLVGDIFVASYSPSGDYRWSKAVAGSLADGSSYTDIAHQVASDADGNVTIVGGFFLTADFGGSPLASLGNSGDVFIASYDASGAHRWSERFGGSSTDVGSGVAVDSNGNVTIAGSFRGSADFGGGPLTSAGDPDIFVASYDASGAHRWSARFGSAGEDHGAALAVGETGDVTLTGSFNDTVDFGGGALTSVGDADIFVASFGPDGAHRWSKAFGSAARDVGIGVAVDRAGNVVLTGSFEQTVDFGGGPMSSAGAGDVFVASFGPDGAHRWSERCGGPSNDSSADVAVDGEGNVVLTGLFQGSADFGHGTLSSAGEADVFVASFSTDGVLRFAEGFGGPAGDAGRGLAVHSSGRITLTGTFRQSIDFGGGLLTSAGGDDIFLVQLSPAP